MSHHDRLWESCRRLEDDYQPYGKTERDGPDCSGECVFYYPLADRDGEPISMDWGVCTNHSSHRFSLLTFEHQGCEHYQVRT
jgi:hypothetical protein